MSGVRHAETLTYLRLQKDTYRWAIPFSQSRPSQL
jgi:hypothetical protein